MNKDKLYFPNFKSLVRGYLVFFNFLAGLSALRTNYYGNTDGSDFLVDVFFICLCQIFFFTLAHFLWGVILWALKRNWYRKYRKGIFHLIEGLNAFLVSILTFPFLIIIAIFTGILLVPFYDNSAWVMFLRSLFIITVGLISSYYYHAGYLFWSWLNHKNKSLNQEYYENQDLLKLKVKMHNDKLERMKNKPWRKNKNKSKSYRNR